MRRAIEPAQASEYPPNIQAILKRRAAASEYLGQELLEIDTDAGWVRIAYALNDAHFNRYGAIHGGVIACIIPFNFPVHGRAGGLGRSSDSSLALS